MKKLRRIIQGVAFLFIIVAIVFLGVSIVEAKPTTDGANCKNNNEMNSFYKVKVSFDSNAKEIVIAVGNGTFKVSDILEGNNLLIDNPTNMGTITSKKPLRIRVNLDRVTSNFAKVKLKLILAETDSKCMSKAEYDQAVKENRKGGTYDTEVTTNIPNLKSTQGKPIANTNINGICRVLMDGTGYETYKKSLSKLKISADDVATYNYRAVDQTGKGHYDTTVAYCQQPSVQFNYTEEQTAQMIASAISSWKKLAASNTPGDEPVAGFDEAFNFAKQEALKVPGHHYENYDGRSKIGDSLTCDWKKEATGNKGDAYYVNKDYYYAKTEEKTNVTYVNNYTGRDKKTSSTNACTRTCEESVVVEYGPPVASKAGLCFEYKVKVTSRVKCSSDIKAQPPTPPSVCTPVPICNSIPGYTHQAGPKEEFDACIQKCDGGKYSQKCSKQCYKQVYGNTKAAKLALDYESSITKKVDNSGLCAGGRYTRNGSIEWSGGGYGRWYCEQNYPMVEAGYHLNRGFKWGNNCSDDCQWTGCDGDTYLNSDEASKDYIRNLEEYNKAISTCKASASCTTKTAYFTINVTYKHKKDKNGKTETTINFPYTENNAKNKASLPSLGKDDTTDNTQASPTNTNIFIPDTTPKGYDGCYDRTSAKNWYQAEWSFPGTWVHNKTGDISYVDKTGTDAWHEEKNKFCVPLNALSVNKKWWEWNQIKKNCVSESEIENSIDYNIQAATTNFGYFGWDFKFSCFYALRNEVCDTTVNGCCNPDDECRDGDCGDSTNGPKNFTFRIVDTLDLFPATNGSSTAGEIVTQPTTTGRTPGFNWTTQARTFKNENYEVDPLELIGKIQQRQGNIYNPAYEDDYLDYSFVLDKEALAAIRNYNANKKYTDYEGDTEIKNGITIYESSLINKYAKKQGNVGCNNDGKGLTCE